MEITFNCMQAARHGVLEMLPTFMLLLLLAGIEFPQTSSAGESQIFFFPSFDSWSSFHFWPGTLLCRVCNRFTEQSTLWIYSLDSTNLSQNYGYLVCRKALALAIGRIISHHPMNDIRCTPALACWLIDFLSHLRTTFDGLIE
jgi:hypothetical protein